MRPRHGLRDIDTRLGRMIQGPGGCGHLEDSARGLRPGKLTASSTPRAPLIFAFRKEATQNEKEICGPLREASHEVGHPGFTEGDIYTEGMPLGDDLLLQVAPDSQQHLKLVLIGGQAERVDPCASVIDERRIVRGDGHAGSGRVRRKVLMENPIEEPAVIGVHFNFLLKCDAGRLEVGSFNQTNLRIQWDA